MKRKIVRRVVDRTYDSFAKQDYSSGQDNLNPIRHMNFAKQISDLEDAVDKKIDVAIDALAIALQKKKLGDGDEYSFSVSEGQGSISDLANSLKSGSLNGRKYPNLGVDAPDWMISKIDRAIAFVMGDPNNKGPDVLNSFHLPTVDCEGVATLVDILGKSNGNQNDPTIGSYKDFANSLKAAGDSTGNATGTEVCNISYELLNGDTGATLGSDVATNSPKNPTSVFMAQFPIALQNPIISNSDYSFVSWYEDAAFSTPIVGKFGNKASTNVTVYAKIKLTANLTDKELALMNNVEDLEDIASGMDAADEANDEETALDDEDTCIIVELQFLKYILIVLKIVKMVCKIVNIAIYLVKTIAEMVGKAGTAWNDPPIVADIIADVTQRVIALVLSVISKLLQKLWNALGLDCIGSWTIDMIGQIMDALAGISGTVTQITSTAVNLSSLKAEISPKKIAEGLKDNLKREFGQLKDTLKNFPNEFQQDIKNGAAQSLDQLKNVVSPNTLLSVVPGQAIEVYNAMNSAIQTAITTYKTTEAALKLAGRQISKNIKGTNTASVRKSEVIV